jgi:dienelactone hydrolase
MSEPRVRSTETRGRALVDDIVFDGPDGVQVEAFLVRPAVAPEPHAAAGVVMWHWLDSEAPDGNRTQFLDEAGDLASSGAVCLLPQGRFPWSRPPTGSDADRAEILAEVARMRAAVDVIAARPEVDRGRLGLVGHDFGGMLAAIEAADDDRLQALVIVAATPRWGDWFLVFWDLPEDRIVYLRAMRSLDPIEVIGRVAAPVLFQFGRSDFYIAAMTGLEFHGAAPRGSELLAYDAGHDMRLPEIRADRRAFLVRTLGLSSTT